MMPSLPSYIARYDSVELPDFDQLEYVMVQRPANATLTAWGKLEEAERRFWLFDWATYVILHPNRCTRLLNDFASAYLLSFEATLQVLQEQVRFPSLEAWLKTQADYDLACRGLRTLRHLEAHVRPGSLSTKRSGAAYSRFAGTSLGGTTPWYWEISSSELSSLQSPKLTAAEVPAWNELAADQLVLGLMRHGVEALQKLLRAAGP